MGALYRSAMEPKMSPDEIRREQAAYIQERWKQLHELEERWAAEAYKYLFLTNAGGAVAVLAFIAQAGERVKSPLVAATLICFALGVILVGCGIAKTFEHMSTLYRLWKADVDRFHSGGLEYKQLTDIDEKRAITDWVDRALPYSAFGLFFVGCILGGLALFMHS